MVRMTCYKTAFLLAYAFSGLSAKGPCTGKEYFKGCCAHTYWNTDIDDCSECPLGFVGLNCSVPCQYPFFGHLCRSICSCNSSFCDLSKGCIPTNETIDHNDGIAAKDKNRPGRISSLLYIFISVSGLMLVVILNMHLALLIVEKKRKKCGVNNDPTYENGIREIVIQDNALEQEM